MDITNGIGESRIPLRALNARTNKDFYVVMHDFEINNAEQLDRIIIKINESRMSLKYQGTSKLVSCGMLLF